MSDSRTIHELIEAEGRQEARMLAPGRRGGRAVDAAAIWMASEDQALGFIYSGWCQTALPHRRRPDDEIWKVDADRLRLLIEPGATRAGKRVGVPYGSTARLILIYLQSEALRTNSREVSLGGSLRQFLTRVGVPIGGRSVQAVRDQAERITLCRIAFYWSDSGRELFAHQNIIDSSSTFLAGNDDDRQGRLFADTAMLSEPFWLQLRRHAVPLDETAISAIKSSSLALDCYCWLAYRLHHLEAPLTVSWAALKAQFGAGFQRVAGFRPSFIEALQVATAVYREAKIEQTAEGVILHPSRPPVAALKRT